MRHYPMVIALLCASSVWAADEPTVDQPVVADVTFSETAASPGDKVVLNLNVRIFPAWHIYAHDPSETFIVTTHELQITDGLSRSGGWFPPPSELYEADPSILIYKDDVTFEHDLEISDDAPAGAQTASVKLRFQACDPYICLPPEEIELSAAIDIREESGGQQ